MSGGALPTSFHGMRTHGVHTSESYRVASSGLTQAPVSTPEQRLSWAVHVSIGILTFSGSIDRQDQLQIPKLSERVIAGPCGGKFLKVVLSPAFPNPISAGALTTHLLLRWLLLKRLNPGRDVTDHGSMYGLPAYPDSIISWMPCSGLHSEV